MRCGFPDQGPGALTLGSSSRLGVVDGSYKGKRCPIVMPHCLSALKADQKVGYTKPYRELKAGPDGLVVLCLSQLLDNP